MSVRKKFMFGTSGTVSSGDLGLEHHPGKSTRSFAIENVQRHVRWRNHQACNAGGCGNTVLVESRSAGAKNLAHASAIVVARKRRGASDLISSHGFDSAIFSKSRANLRACINPQSGDPLSPADSGNFNPKDPGFAGRVERAETDSWFRADHLQTCGRMSTSAMLRILPIAAHEAHSDGSPRCHTAEHPSR